MKTTALILSCEHGVNTIPEAYQPLFSSSQDLLNSHAGIDFGALAIASYLHDALNCELFSAKTSRLFIDCNRSLRHRHSFSQITRQLPLAEKEAIIQQYYWPFRKDVETKIDTLIDSGKQVWHVSIHSFTPILNNIIRKTDVGLLFDPRRFSEKQAARQWRQQFLQSGSKFKLRFNYPYLGISDGFTTALRKKYPEDSYIGLELEINQALIQENETRAHLACVLAKTLRSAQNKDISTIGT